MQQLKIDLNRIQTFITLVDSQSFTKAALVLKQPKSRVSRHISSLEKSLNTQLIYRTTRQIHLTEAGKNFYQNCRQHLLEIKESILKITDSSNEISGSIKMTAPDDLSIALVSQVCSEFMLRHPKINLDLVITNSVVDMVKMGIDLAIRVGQPKDSTFLSRKVGRINQAVVASPDYLKKFEHLPSPQNISQFSCLTSTFGSHPEQWILFNSNGDKKIFNFAASVKCSNHFVLKKLVLDGRGLCQLPLFLIQDEIKSGELVDLFHHHRAEGQNIYLLYPPQKKISLKIKKISDMIALYMEERLN